MNIGIEEEEKCHDVSVLVYQQMYVAKIQIKIFNTNISFAPISSLLVEYFHEESKSHKISQNKFYRDCKKLHWTRNNSNQNIANAI